MRFAAMDSASPQCHPFEGKLAVMVNLDREGYISKGRLIPNHNEGRGFCAHAVIWLREPTREEREALLPSLIANGGRELYADTRPTVPCA
jgi:hypothetical protein